jgi:hypothetical protein
MRRLPVSGQFPWSRKEDSVKGFTKSGSTYIIVARGRKDGAGGACRRAAKGLTVRASDAIFPVLDAGWSSLVARRAHNPKVAGSNPAPAIARPRRRSRAAFCWGSKAR